MQQEQLDWGDISMPLVWFGDWSRGSCALFSPHCTERNFIWQRVGWNARALSCKLRLASWLSLFPWRRGGENCTLLQVSGTEALTSYFWMQMWSDLWQANRKSDQRWTIKPERLGIKTSTANKSNPWQQDWTNTCTAGASSRWYLTGSETTRFGIGNVVPNPSPWQMLQLLMAMTAKCWQGFGTANHQHSIFSLFLLEKISLCRYLSSNRNKSKQSVQSYTGTPQY